MPEIPKLEFGDRLVKVLRTEGEEILEDNFLPAKELEDKNILEIKQEHEFNKIKDALDEGTITLQLDFLCGGEHLPENFKHAVIFYHLMMKILDSLIFFAQSEVKILRPITVYLYMLNSEIFFTRTSTGMKIFIVYFWYNKTKQNQ